MTRIAICLQDVTCGGVELELALRLHLLLLWNDLGSVLVAPCQLHLQKLILKHLRSVERVLLLIILSQVKFLVES